MAGLSTDFASLDALYHAYRKAKVDVFYERTQPFAIDFAAYEADLKDNLLALAKRLTSADPDWFRSVRFLGSHGYIPKGLHLDPLGAAPQHHFTACDPALAWRQATQRDRISAEFRAVAHFTVDMYVICALWVNTAGDKFDACLSPTAMGARLRRLASERPDTAGPYHLNSQGSFKPYFYSYRDWRQQGLAAIRRELSEGKRVVALTMDLTSFYHSVDPSFLEDDSFRVACRAGRVVDDLDENERLLTHQLVEAFATWGKTLPTWTATAPVGLPVGPSASRVIANVILTDFDHAVAENLAPAYYGRYIDDVFLVINDPGNLRSADDVLQHMLDRLSMLQRTPSGDLELVLPYQRGSILTFRRDKQRIFLLSGEVGSDLVDTIEARIDEVSSEWRMLPELDDLERSPAARVLTANRDSSDNADSLRKADALSIKRLSFALLLRSLDAAARDLQPPSWQMARWRFYEFAMRQAVTPLRALDLNDYLPRLLGLSVACADWRWARRILHGIRRSIDEVEQAAEDVDERTWQGYRHHVSRSLTEAIACAVATSPQNAETPARVRTLLDIVDLVSPHQFGETDSLDMRHVAHELLLSDLGRRPYKDMALADTDQAGETFRTDGSNEGDRAKWRWAVQLSFRSDVISSALAESGRSNLPLRPFLFPTRPLTPGDITELVPACVTDRRRWAILVEAFRGVWVRSDPEGEGGDGSDGIVCVGRAERREGPTVAVTSFLVDDRSWSLAAAGRPDLSAARHQQIVRLANQVVKAKPRPDYVVFPELAIPRPWVTTVAHHFLRSGISLITGVEYRHYGEGRVSNEAKLYLVDDRLGYTSYSVITQEKSTPAHHERELLRSMFGLECRPALAPTKPVYAHNGFYFGVLICSELTDVNHRMAYRGRADAVFVLCWNQDLESFAALTESSALDTHCFIVLANNRRYGDSRLRGPYRDSWKRDVVRVKGGLDDYFVVARLGVGELREYQSYAEPPVSGTFKPIPDGFEMASHRYRIPGGG